MVVKISLGLTLLGGTVAFEDFFFAFAVVVEDFVFAAAVLAVDVDDVAAVVVVVDDDDEVVVLFGLVREEVPTSHLFVD